MTPPETRIEWRVPLAPDARRALARQYLFTGARLFVVCVPLAWAAAGPSVDWIVFVSGLPDTGQARPMRWMLGGLIGLYPMMFLVLAAQVARGRPSDGHQFRLDDAAIRWSDKARHWKQLRAAAVERDDSDRPTRVRLLGPSGRVTTVEFPADPILADAAAAFILARVPAYDADVHGPLDVPSDVPAAAVWFLTFACAAFLVACHLLGDAVGPTRTQLRTGLLAAAIVPIAWYVGVRFRLSRPARDRAFAYAIAALMATPMLATLVIAAPEIRRLYAELRAIPADERERVARTVSVKRSN